MQTHNMWMRVMLLKLCFLGWHWQDRISIKWPTELVVISWWEAKNPDDYGRPAGGWQFQRGRINSVFVSFAVYIRMNEWIFLTKCWFCNDDALYLCSTTIWCCDLEVYMVCLRGLSKGQRVCACGDESTYRPLGGCFYTRSDITWPGKLH